MRSDLYSRGQGLRNKLFNLCGLKSCLKTKEYLHTNSTSPIRGQDSEGHNINLPLIAICLHTATDSTHNDVIKIGYTKEF